MLGAFIRRALVVVGALSMVGTLINASPAVAQSACSNPTITLTPANQTVAFNAPASVTATVTDSCGAVSGALVNFTSIAGTNFAQATSATTNASGVAVGTFTSTKSGADAVRASTGTVFSNTVLINWAIIQEGRAYSLESTGLVPVAKQQDTGLVSRIDDYTTGSKCAALVPGAVTLGLLCNQVSTGSQATSTPKRGALTISSAKTAIIGIAGVPTILATGVSTFAGVQCDIGAQGVTNIATLKIGLNSVLNLSNRPAPNTVIPLGAGRIILNEQKPSPSGLGIEVNAIHVIVPGVADVVVSSAMAQLIGCPPAVAG